jgi:hypothetical protein
MSIRQGDAQSTFQRGIMKTAFVLMLSVAASFAAERPAEPKPVKDPDARVQTDKTGEVKRLGSVTWDLDAHKLVWVVEKGSMVNGEFVPTSEQRYAISPDQARMIVEDEERGFDGQEAVSLHKLLDVLSLYCAESVVWWDEGQGTPGTKMPTNDSEKPAKPELKDGKPVKVGSPEPPKKPKYRVPDDHIIARAQW